MYLTLSTHMYLGGSSGIMCPALSVSDHRGLHVDIPSHQDSIMVPWRHRQPARIRRSVELTSIVTMNPILATGGWWMRLNIQCSDMPCLSRVGPGKVILRPGLAEGGAGDLDADP